MFFFFLIFPEPQRHTSSLIGRPLGDSGIPFSEFRGNSSSPRQDPRHLLAPGEPSQLSFLCTWACPHTVMMMWSNFLMQEEDRRRGASGRARGQHESGLSPEQEGKIKLVLLLTAVGATLAVLAVGTEFWVELNTFKANGSAVCDAVHLGLWKMCTKRLWQADLPVDRETCGPAELPGGELAPRA